MTDLQIFVAVVFIIGNLAISAYDRRTIAPKSRREQIARIRATRR